MRWCSLRVGRQAGPYTFTKRRTPLLAQRHHVSGRRRLTAQERRPEVVKVAENRRYFDSAYLDVPESCPPEEFGQRVRLAQSAASSFVQLPGLLGSSAPRPRSGVSAACPRRSPRR